MRKEGFLCNYTPTNTVTSFLRGYKLRSSEDQPMCHTCTKHKDTVCIRGCTRTFSFSIVAAKWGCFIRAYKMLINTSKERTLQSILWLAACLSYTHNGGRNKSVHHFVLFKDVPVLKMHSGGGSDEILEVRAHSMEALVNQQSPPFGSMSGLPWMEYVMCTAVSGRN